MTGMTSHGYCVQRAAMAVEDPRLKGMVAHDRTPTGAPRHCSEQAGVCPPARINIAPVHGGLIGFRFSSPLAALHRMCRIGNHGACSFLRKCNRLSAFPGRLNFCRYSFAGPSPDF
jgi:hypothetical protein